QRPRQCQPVRGSRISVTVQSAELEAIGRPCDRFTYCVLRIEAIEMKSGNLPADPSIVAIGEGLLEALHDGTSRFFLRRRREIYPDIITFQTRWIRTDVVAAQNALAIFQTEFPV